LRRGRAMVALISVVTVNRNDASGLRATARSVAAQKRPAEQWIVVDGGSTDGSIGVIRQFARAMDYWTSAPDPGVYDAMNQGLRTARGRYVIFLNAGDRFPGADTLARIAAVLRANPGRDLLFGGTILDLPSGRRLYRPPHSAARVRFGLPAYHQATVIRRARTSDGALRSYATRLRRLRRDRDADQPRREQHPRKLAICDPRVPPRQPVGTGDRAAFRRFHEGSVAGSRLRPLYVSAGVARLALAHLAYRAVRGGRAEPNKADAIRAGPDYRLLEKSHEVEG
jgi:glycosyltransferase involved in cell wall biosynthesis